MFHSFIVFSVTKQLTRVYDQLPNYNCMRVPSVRDWQ